MRIDQIKSFLSVAKNLSFTVASQKLFVSQSVLSRQIAAMESELNVQLFLRSPSNISLTPNGVLAYEAFSRIIDDYNFAVKQIQNPNPHITGKICIGKLLGQLSDTVEKNLWLQWQNCHPNVLINIERKTNRELMSGFENGTYDLIMTWMNIFQSRKDAYLQILRNVHTVIGCSKHHHMAGKSNGHITDFQNDTWLLITQEESNPLLKDIYQIFHEYNMNPDVVYVDDPNMMVDMVIENKGIALMNIENTCYYNSLISFVSVPEIPDTPLVLAKNISNKNGLAQDIFVFFQNSLN